MSLRCIPEENIYCVVLIFDGDEIYCPVAQELYEKVREVPPGDYSKFYVELQHPIIHADGEEAIVRLNLGGKHFRIPVTEHIYENISAHGVMELT